MCCICLSNGWSRRATSSHGPSGGLGSRLQGKSSSVLKKHLDANCSLDSRSLALIVSSFVRHLGTEKKYPKRSSFLHRSVIDVALSSQDNLNLSQQGCLNFCAQQTRPPTTTATSSSSLCLSPRKGWVAPHHLFRGYFTNEPMRGSQTKLCVFVCAFFFFFFWPCVFTGRHYNQLS